MKYITVTTEFVVGLLLINITFIACNSYIFKKFDTGLGCSNVFKYYFKSRTECVASCLIKTTCIAVRTNGEQCEHCIVGLINNISLITIGYDFKVYTCYSDSGFNTENALGKYLNLYNTFL